MEAIEDESFVILGASMSDFDERQFRLMSSMNGVKDDGDPLVESTTTMNGHSSLSGGAGISLCSINTVELNSLLRQFPNVFNSQLAEVEREKFIGILKEYCMMKENLRRSNIAIREHFSMMSSYQHDIKRSREEDLMKIKRLTEEIEMVRSLRDKVHEELENLRGSTNVQKRDHEKYIGELFGEKVQLQNELQRATESVAALNATIVAKDSEIDEMKKQNSELMSVVNNLKAAIETHEKQLATFEIINHESLQQDRDADDQGKKRLEEEILGYKASINNLRTLLLEKDRQIIEMKTSSIESQGKMIPYDEHKKIIDELMTNNGRIVEEQVKIKQQQSGMFQAKNEQIAELQSQVDELMKNMEVMRMQCDVYKQDFELERKAREDIHGERLVLMTELERLKKQNEKLVKDISSGPSGSNTGVRKSLSPPGNRTLANHRATGPPIIQHYCPLCSAVYTDSRALENHVQDCLDGKCFNSMSLIN